MSRYTTELRYIYTTKPNEVIETFSSYELTDYLTHAQINALESAGKWSKNKLAHKIIDNYYFREIGFETWGMFKHYTLIEMQKIMEHYLPLLYSRDIEYDPLVNVDYTETYSSSSSGNNTSKGSSSSDALSNSTGNTKFSDTPSVGLVNVKEGRYLTNANFSETGTNTSGSSSSQNTSNSSDTQTYTKNIKGNSGVSATAQKMIEQFRDNIIAIDAKIIESLNPLFMTIY